MCSIAHSTHRKGVFSANILRGNPKRVEEVNGCRGELSKTPPCVPLSTSLEGNLMDIVFVHGKGCPNGSSGGLEFKGSTCVGKDGGDKVPIKWGLIERVSHFSGDTCIAYTWGRRCIF